MRESIGGTWLFGLVITFIVFFASFLALSINYAKAFNIKNGIVDLIGKYEGNSIATRKNIAEYLEKEGYMVTGTCDEGYTGYLLNKNVNNNYEAEENGKAYYCVQRIDDNGDSPITKSYYKVEVFFKIDLPVVGAITNFKIKGETETVYYAIDD